MRLHSIMTAAVAATTLLALSACAPATAPTEDDAALTVVASTNVYGDLASTIAGDDAEVTSIITSAAQDPHSYEATAQDQLAISNADILVINGGGYDDWADVLIAGAQNPDLVVLNASDISGFDQNPAEGEFNEHVWYSFDAMASLTDALVVALSDGDPDASANFQSAGETFKAELDALTSRAQAIGETNSGAGAAITEPVPVYLLEASDLVNVTPDAFSEAIEEGTDVSPVVLAETLALFTDGTAVLLVYNDQVTGPETERILAAATEAGTPVVPMTETLPDGLNYIAWMSQNIDGLEAALA